jgi:flavin reductase (DIM6/NTAB) family NADH-FMN oxidoreductase RutF
VKQELALPYAHRLLAPRPVCLLTTRYKGQVNVMSLGWACPISLEPPLLSLAMHPSCYTHDMLKRSQEAVLNIPGRALAEQVHLCGNLSGAEGDKIQRTGLTLDAGRRVQAPWIVECLAHVECAIVDTFAPGDHTLFIAEVLGAWVEEDAFDGVWKLDQENEELLPLMHLGGKVYCLAGKKVVLP